MWMKFLDLAAGALKHGALAAGVALLVVPPASANDSSASLDVDGLHFTYNPNIEVESEALSLSLDEVLVGYHFRNTSDHDISTLVAFPLPVMYIGEDGNYVLPDGRDPVNFIDFQVTVDGKPVKPSAEAKAARFGVDVTDVLRKYGIPLTMLDKSDTATIALHEKLDDLPEDARNELERYGVIDWTTSFGANDKPLATTHWETYITFYWFQTFPAKRTIEVRHSYHPVPRYFFFSDDDLTSDMRPKYCFDDAFTKATRAMLKQMEEAKPDFAAYLQGRELRYVLTTAGNWHGPIGKFSLRIVKPSPEALVSLCANGLKRTSPTTFELTETDYSPGEDLNVLFLLPFSPDDAQRKAVSRTIRGRDLLPHPAAATPSASPSNP